ncbi:hypothetical protein SK128_025354 [Halocaridina rubra]|uniref:Uncharacterized protein n=1 Tax=Halocaridina rubra TaxID=373956 RepID=A0AAN8WDM4_HALRR
MNLTYTGCIFMLIIIITTVLLVVIYPQERQLAKRNVLSVLEVEDYIIQNTSPGNIRSYLRHMTLKPHLGGTDGEKELARWIADTWKEQGLDEVHLVPYQVLVSNPSPDIPNVVRILDEKNEVIWTSAPKQKPLYAPEEASQDIPFTFNAYGAAGNVTTSEQCSRMLEFTGADNIFPERQDDLW